MRQLKPGVFTTVFYNSNIECLGTNSWPPGHLATFQTTDHSRQPNHSITT